MRWSKVIVIVGYFALLLAGALGALRLGPMQRLDRNSFNGVRCENEIGEVVSGATLMFNATTPPTDCFIVTTMISSGDLHMMVNFTTSCEGFLQCKKNDNWSNAKKLEAYPPRPPVTEKIDMNALSGQEEPVILRSNVQSSNTGQIRVEWVFAPSTGEDMVTLSPNGDKNSLILTNLTTADTGEYYPVATATSSLLTIPDWKTVVGQRYLLKVFNFEQPRFTTNLTCREEPGQKWRCITRATGTEINYNWFINSNSLTTNDNRVSSMFRSSGTIVLHNLKANDTLLTVEISSMKNLQTYRISQSAAILVPSESFCPTTQPLNGSCFLPWLPILCGIIFVLVLISFCLIFCLCGLYSLNSDNASRNHDVLIKLNENLLRLRSTRSDGDDDDDIVEKREPIIEEMLTNLQRILNLE